MYNKLHYLIMQIVFKTLIFDYLPPKGIDGCNNYVPVTIIIVNIVNP